MFKDYLLIQNAQEHEMEGKGPTHGEGEGGDGMALFVYWLSY